MNIKITMLLTALFSTGLSYAQSFKGHASGTFGIVNQKVRVQYEIPIKSSASYGINMNYYLANWKGPVFEPFIRTYRKKDGNTEGFFGQAKLIYGNLSTFDSDLSGFAVEEKRWSTYGFGISCGNKFLLGKHFTIEYMTGVRLLSAPPVTYDYFNYDKLGWYLTTGLPIDLQLKFGFQF
jgi:hypothetical protein